MTKQQRLQQYGRIHRAKAKLGLADEDYRDLLEAITGERSCTRMTDRQVNRCLDWLNYLQGIRPQPRGFARDGLSPHANLVGLASAISRIVPPGYQVNPIRSPKWQERVAGRSCAFFDEFTVDELTRLVEGVKAIFRRLGQRDTETLHDKPLTAGEQALSADAERVG